MHRHCRCRVFARALQLLGPSVCFTYLVYKGPDMKSWSSQVTAVQRWWSFEVFSHFLHRLRAILLSVYSTKCCVSVLWKMSFSYVGDIDMFQDVCANLHSPNLVVLCQKSVFERLFLNTKSGFPNGFPLVSVSQFLHYETSEWIITTKRYKGHNHTHSLGYRQGYKSPPYSG